MLECFKEYGVQITTREPIHRCYSCPFCTHLGENKHLCEMLDEEMNNYGAWSKTLQDCPIICRNARKTKGRMVDAESLKDRFLKYALSEDEFKRFCTIINEEPTARDINDEIYLLNALKEPAYPIGKADAVEMVPLSDAIEMLKMNVDLRSKADWREI